MPERLVPLDGPPEGLTTGELLGYWKARAAAAELALYNTERDGEPWPHSPALVYCAAGSSLRIQVDDADLGFLSARERALCVALLRHALTRFEEAADA